MISPGPVSASPQCRVLIRGRCAVTASLFHNEGQLNLEVIFKGPYCLHGKESDSNHLSGQRVGGQWQNPSSCSRLGEHFLCDLQGDLMADGDVKET